MSNTFINKIKQLFYILQKELCLLDNESAQEIAICQSNQDFLDLAYKDIRRKYLSRLLEKYDITQFENESTLPLSLKKEIDRYSNYL